MLTLARLEELASSTYVGGTTASGNSIVLLANNAGRFLMGMHQWGFAEGNQTYLPFRVSVPTDASSGGTVAATYAPLTKRVTFPAAFTNYIWKSGDLMRVSADDSPAANTDFRTSDLAIPGLYEIASKVSSDTVELVESPVITGAQNGAFLRISIDLAYAELPVDFSDTLEVEMAESLTSRFEWTSLGHILRLRSDSEGDSRVYRGALNYGVDTVVNKQPTPRVELYPAPLTNTAEAMRMFYRHGWVDIDNDNDVLRLPSYMEPLYLEVFRCFLLGTEEHDIGTVNLRLAEVKAGPVYMAAKADDGRSQGNMGKMRGTHVRPSSFGTHYSRRQINSPS